MTAAERKKKSPGEEHVSLNSPQAFYDACDLFHYYIFKVI